MRIAFHQVPVLKMPVRLLAVDDDELWRAGASRQARTSRPSGNTPAAAGKARRAHFPITRYGSLARRRPEVAYVPWRIARDVVRMAMPHRSRAHDSDREHGRRGVSLPHRRIRASAFRSAVALSPRTWLTVNAGRRRVDVDGRRAQQRPLHPARRR